ncbi:hypothetical protein H0H93_009988 [Arthromyces matolae]|nr:hypothetical protein H0H93_009988 [Arthromyces matolae]
MAGGPAVSSGTLAYSHVLDPNRKWFNNSRIITLNAWLVLLLITSSTNGYDGSMMNGLQSLSQWNDFFNSPHGGTLGLFNAIQNIGSLAAYPFAPYLSDGIGRRRTIILGAAIMCIATILQTAAQNFGMFIGARFLIGFGLTFAANAAPMLVTELSYPPYRAPLTSVYNSLWYSGAIIAAWTTFGTFKINSTWAWRVPSALQGLPSVLQIILIWWCPESPRWLVSKGREAEAEHILAYYHADGNAQDPLIRFELDEIKAALEFDRTVADNVSWKSLISTPGNRKRLRIIIALAFFSQWSGNGLVSYYLNKVFDGIGITNPTTQLLINGILQIWNLGWALMASFMYANPIAIDNIKWKYYLVYVVWLIVETVFVYFFIVETKNRSLEETAALFDGEEAVETIASHHVASEAEKGSPTEEPIENKVIDLICSTLYSMANAV